MEYTHLTEQAQVEILDRRITELERQHYELELALSTGDERAGLTAGDVGGTGRLAALAEAHQDLQARRQALLTSIKADQPTE